MAKGHSKLHATEHQAEDIDEIPQASLLPQIPIPHAERHRLEGDDPLSGINATQIGKGDVTNIEYQMLDGVNTNSKLVTKDMLDAVVQGLDWQESVLSIQKDPPTDPTEGDRYLIDEDATSVWSPHVDSITEWDGSSWIFIPPDPGFITLVEDEGKWYMYDGTEWSGFSEAITHGDLLGLGEDDHLQYFRTDGTRNLEGSLIPEAPFLYNIGSETAHFNNLYLSTLINTETNLNLRQLSDVGMGTKKVDIYAGAEDGGQVSIRAKAGGGFGNILLNPDTVIDIEGDMVFDTDYELNITQGKTIHG